ncbi:peptide ABC transporter permease protein [Gottschalkia purinilytica]|uniref:Peptide ABC transporter permease protein n=1 Tax=Gottschalkia purinilytica TaxID=1503 RepID=A0A0L0W761_GOTPU|nr:ABC transporter permease [Gottschalkia purinilytica]KNF07312.1 peptide ABC transporter permease protein [Gottschalkia purinilytica]
MDRRILESIKYQINNSLLAKVYIGIIITFVVFSLLAPLSPYDPEKIDILNKLSKPSIKHIFGTDDLGRDYFTRALYGGRVSLSVGIMSMSISVTIGILIGTISGFFGGIVDNILMRLVDILMSIPRFFIILILNAYLKPGILTIVIIIGAFGWMEIARIVRAETLSIKEREYIICSKLLGADFKWILFKHIIPNIMSTVIVASTINIANSILTESSLSFLGLGIQQPYSSWGSMLKNAQQFISDAPYLSIFPGILILLTVLSLNVLGDILKISLNPKENI